MPLKRRPATEEDKEFCFAVSRKTYEEVVTLQFGYWDDPWQRARFEERWLPGKFEIIQFDNLPIGVLWADWRDDHRYLAELQIIPQYQGRGFGSALIMQEQEAAREKKVPLRLQVLKMNKAINLYKRLGFDIYAESDTHYQMSWVPVIK